jgi:hypothetical protein
MNQLSSETLIDIFGRLKFKDKLQCALTCREWYTKLISIGLYGKISFPHQQKDLQTKVKLRSIRDKDLGYRIVNLYLNEIDDLLELSELFPNIKSLRAHTWLCDDWNSDNNALLAQNWQKLESIEEGHSFHRNTCCCLSLTMILLASPLYMKSLSYLKLNFYNLSSNLLPTLIEQLKHVPSIESLILEYVSNLDYEKLNVLHENTPNLKHFALKQVNCQFVGTNTHSATYHPLPIGRSIVRNLNSFSVDIYDYIPYLEWEINVVHWIEYLSRKYTNLTSISVAATGPLKQYNKDIAAEFIKNAALSGNLTRLKKLEVPSAFLSANALRAMDDSNICLEELKIYITSNEDMEQFINLTRSNQGKTIQKLAIVDDNAAWWPNQEYLVSFLQSMKESDSQLKEIDIGLLDPDPHDSLFTPMIVLEYIPSLQKLSMLWAGVTDIIHLSYNETILLAHLTLKFEDDFYDDYPVLDYYTLHYIQNMLYALPFLQSFSTDWDNYHFYGATFDFKENTKLERINLEGAVIRIVQNDKIKWCNPIQDFPQEEFPDDKLISLTLHLAPSIRSIFINDAEYTL